MDVVEAEVCPRCQESYIPNNLNPGAFPGALSRWDNTTYICSVCGEDEAIGGFGESSSHPGRVTAPTEWPTKPSEFTLRLNRTSEFARARMMMLERGP